MSATVSSWVRTASAVGWAKTVRIVAATISAEPFGITVKTLRTKWTRQRCQAAPSMTLRIALTKPLWLSEMTRRTPVRPRSRNERRNSVQNASVSLSPTMTPRTSRPPSSVTPVAMTTAWETI